MAKPKKLTFRDIFEHHVEPEDTPQPHSAMYDKVRSCLSKVPHLTRAIAEGVATQDTAKFREKFVAYKCRWCSQFHVGHEIL